MPNSRKRNAPGRGRASLSKLAGGGSGQNKILRCGVKHISILRRRIHAAGLSLSSTRTESQLNTLLKVLQHLGEDGLNTPEGVGIGFARIATRVFDLELRGWRIDSLREDVITADGLKHKGIARYVLRGRRTDFIDPQGSLDLGARS
jgi:hypothetical protein